MITIDQKRLYTWSARLTIALAVLGFISSYITLWLVASDYGYNVIQATIFPLLVDAFMIVIHLVWFFLTINGVKDGWARAIMYLTVSLSVVLNISHAWGDVDYLGLVVWAVPPLTLLGSVKAMAWLVRAAMADQKLPETYQETTKTLPETISALPEITPEAETEKEEIAETTRETTQLTGKQLAVLEFISANGPISSGEIAEQFHAKPSFTRRHAKPLEDAGLVTKNGDGLYVTNGKH